MKLSQPFYRLPFRFDTARLLAEVEQFGPEEWVRHPQGFPGNSAVRLITVGGGDNDAMAGPMQPTPALARSPYIRQILTAFGVPWSRSRLMRLAPGAVVPSHSDINYHWMNRVRVHIPVVTHAAVRFSSGDESVHMAAGEAWTFDNWRSHEVVNASSVTRIHLVADTVGNARFWGWVNGSEDHRQAATRTEFLPYRTDIDPRPVYESFNAPILMPAAELDMLVGDLLNDLAPPHDMTVYHRFVGLAVALIQEWRGLWSQYGVDQAGWPHFARLQRDVRNEVQKLGRDLQLRSNKASAVEVFVARVLLYCFNPPQSNAAEEDVDRTLRAASPSSDADAVAEPKALPQLDRPVFIIAAPRSGSTLLFETLAQLPNVYTLGGEGHGWIEAHDELTPFGSGKPSNRLDAGNASPDVREKLLAGLVNQVRDRDGAVPAEGAIRFLEKTPKNALRVPFLNALFPDARFIFLTRDAEENLGSIIDAWNAGGWVTYRDLEGWDGPWSLLLTPGWEAMRGQPLAEIAAHQWSIANLTALADLQALPPERWTTVTYAELVADPLLTVERLARFADFRIDDSTLTLLSNPLPLSAYTLAPPKTDKWLRHAESIERVKSGLSEAIVRISEATARN